MSPGLAHIKDIRAAEREMLQKLADTEEYVQDLSKLAQHLQNRVDELEVQLQRAGRQNNDMCDQIFDLEDRAEDLRKQLKEATTTP